MTNIRKFLDYCAMCVFEHSLALNFMFTLDFEENNF